VAAVLDELLDGEALTVASGVAEGVCSEELGAVQPMAVAAACT